MRTAFAVGAADASISAAESAELNEIGKELGFRSDEVDAIRNEFRDQSGGHPGHARRPRRVGTLH